MKIRTSFVTNSSSSSFICDVCGATESGYDMGLKDANMYECVNGHTFCESHLLPAGEPAEDEDDDFERCGTPAIRCPICQFKAIKVEDAFKFLLKTIPLNEHQVLTAMRTHATGDYKQLQQILKEK
jgi:hypothetical protein